MPDQDTILETLESAARDVPVCHACGEPTALNTHADGTIWLECSNPTKPNSTLRRVLAVDASHYRREVVAAA